MLDSALLNWWRAAAFACGRLALRILFVDCDVAKGDRRSRSVSCGEGWVGCQDGRLLHQAGRLAAAAWWTCPFSALFSGARPCDLPPGGPFGCFRLASVGPFGQRRSLHGA